MPTNQISSVLVTSQMLRVRALMYFVTETPHKLNTIIENTPRIANETSRVEEPTDSK